MVLDITKHHVTGEYIHLSDSLFCPLLMCSVKLLLLVPYNQSNSLCLTITSYIWLYTPTISSSYSFCPIPS